MSGNRAKARLPATHRALLRRVLDASRTLGTPAYAVGGGVRDWLLGRDTKDLDVAVEGPVRPLLSRALPRGLRSPGLEFFDRFGTARWAAAPGRIDFAQTRLERYPEPAALPVVEAADLRTDLVRRDFTVNAMAAPLEAVVRGSDLRAGLVDPCGGAADLSAGRLRALHGESFRDDPTRIFRAARFSGRFGFALEPATQGLLEAAVEAGHVRRLSRERLRDEFLRVLSERDPRPALKLLRAWRVLDVVQPDLKWQASDFDGPDPWVRLGSLALRLGPTSARGFLEGLRLDRERRLALEAAVSTSASRAAPRAPLPPVALESLRRAFPRLPRAALAPVFVTGEDLKRRGLAPGPGFRDLLDELARAQWAGRVRSKADALDWLGRRLQPSPRRKPGPRGRMAV